MQRVARITDQSGLEVSYVFECPGCGLSHSFRTESPTRGLPMWTFNGDVERPTFSPSILVQWGKPQKTAEGERLPNIDMRCHSYVREGRIEFLSDCSHHLAGKTVDLPEPTDWL
jgi:hypothetical protein